MSEENYVVLVSSSISGNDKTLFPVVSISVGGQEVTVPVDHAKGLAYTILQAAYTAEQDCNMVRFAVTRIGISNPEEVSTLLDEYRKMREEDGSVEESGRSPLHPEDSTEPQAEV